MSTFTVVAASEMGDKTQLLILAFSACCPLPTVVTGALLGLIATNLLAALVGVGVGMALPVAKIKLGAGVLFLIFAGLTLWSKDEEEDDSVASLRSPLAVAGAFFMAELGDKTQLAALTLAARYQSFWPIWLGACAGMIVAIGLAIGFGHFVGKNIPSNVLKWCSAAIFGLFGIITIVSSLGQL